MLNLMVCLVMALGAGAAENAVDESAAKVKPVKVPVVANAAARQNQPLQVNGVFPNLTVMADGVGSNSETGIGALIPWANRLWAVGYVAHIHGKGIGLYEISDDMTMRLHPESVTGTFANRMIHWESQQAIIGPHLIDPAGNVRTIAELSKHRLTATARHLKDPKNMVYYLTMEGHLFEANVHTLAVKHLAYLNDELEFPKGAYTHYKGAFTSQGRLVVANNTYEEPEFLEKRAAGRLAQWDGKGEWEILERNPFIEVSGKQNPGAGSYYGNPLYAVGWDNRSVILRVLYKGKWSRYRLPRGSHSWSHTWNTEWMRIREVQTERYMMDAFGIFYELPPLMYGNKLWGVRPICNHLRICPDMVFWRGLFVLAGDQTDNAVGQPQSGLWFGNIDDLWKWGKPSGWGAVWRKTAVKAGRESDPFLMTGFDKKVVHMCNDSELPVNFTLYVDYLGDGTWKQYKQFNLAGGEYIHHEFPDGFSAHWIKAVTDKDCIATIQFMYN